MKKATLAIIRKGNEVLLGLKKKGEIGTQTFNGPGGKCEGDESLLDCVIRETREELGIELDVGHLELIAVITFFAAGVPDFEVYVFYTDVFSGTLAETDDMIPQWFSIDGLPFDRMLESDHRWFRRAVEGEKFRAEVYYRERAVDFEKINFSPF